MTGEVLRGDRIVSTLYSVCLYWSFHTWINVWGWNRSICY